MKKTVLSDFKWKVLSAATEIPLGETRSYKWIAKRIGKPKAVSAVGQALKNNPYVFIIPCHRVIKSDGSLGGYALGVKRKKRLLAKEKEIASFLKRKKQ